MTIGQEPERTKATRPARPRAQTAGANGKSEITREELDQLLDALHAARDGETAARLPVRGKGIAAELNRAFNELADRREAFGKEIARVGRVIGREGRMTERASSGGAGGHWAETVDALNTLIDDLVRPTTEVARVIDAVADGEAARRVETSTRLIVNSTSLGSVTSLIESRARWEGDRVPAGLLRLSVGLEDPEEIWADLAQALDNA